MTTGPNAYACGWKSCATCKNEVLASFIHTINAAERIKGVNMGAFNIDRYKHGICLAAIFLIAWTGTSWAAGVWLYEQGTPDLGTASAGRMALAENAATAVHNPAGMTRLDESQVMLGVQPLWLRIEFDPDSETTTTGSDGEDDPMIGAGGLYYIHSLKDDLKLGLSMGSYFGLGMDYGDDWVGRYYVTEVEFLTYSLIPTVGYRVNDWLSVGGGVNMIYATLNQKAAINNVLDALPDGELELDDDDFGCGVILSVLLEPWEHTRFGLAYNSEVDLEFDDALSLKGLGPGLSAALGGVRGSKVDLDMTLPQALMFSVYHDINDQWAIMGNLGWQEWSEFGKSDVTISSNTTTSFTSDRNYDDTWHVALGVRYRFAPEWMWSAGFAYDSSPVDDEDRTADLPLDRQIRYATGFQYQWDEAFTLSAAYEYVDFGKAEIDQSRGPLAGRLKGEYDTNEAHFFLLNVNWAF